MTSPSPIGHNNPPSPLETAAVTISSLGAFLKNNPAITHENATEAATLIESARRVAADIEKERDDKVRPLNEQVSEINLTYKAVHNRDDKKPGTLDKLLAQLRQRVTDFARAEERRRAEAAAKLAREAAEAERLARKAEAAEQAAAIDVAFGAAIDPAQATVAADRAFSAYQKADRVAARAERDVPVRLATGLGRSVSLRTKETLYVDDWSAAMNEIGLTVDIAEAIKTAARAYRKLNGKLPAGIRAETEREV